ncbi:MAG: DUF1284 domain-containing protein [Holosporales bacterium]|jgi:hypothetical protein|nr:DUF1284 domain-containing protein [Holosporales bacterium]
MSFRGKGYDDVFVSETGKIVKILKTTPNEKLTCITNGCDDVCEHCPERNGKLCKDEFRVSKLDSSFSKILNVREGDNYCFSEICQMTKDKVLIGKFEEICYDCRWIQICRSELLAFRP